MTKFLLTIVLIVTGLNLLIHSGTLLNKYATVKIALQDEEGKNEKEKQENTKQDNEDKFHEYNRVHNALINAIGILPSSLRHSKPCSGFVDKPYTPPDLI